MTASRFVTADGVEVPAITTDQMREVDRVAIEETGPNLYQMMENAGRSLAAVALDQLDPDGHGSVVVMAGLGGNGGGGICAARHLANRGRDVVLVLSDESRIDGVPGQQLEIFRSTPGRTVPADEVAGLKPGLIIDALIGYSLSGSPRERARQLIEWANSTDSPILSLDVPSGLDASTGEAPGEHVIADWTLTLALPKTGLDVDAVGRLMLADLGIPMRAYRVVGLEVSPLIFANSFTVPIRPAK